MRRLADHGMLRPEVTDGELAELLWLLTRFDSFGLRGTGRAQRVDEVAEALMTTERSLCG